MTTMHDIDPNLLHPSLLSRSRDASEAKLKDVLKRNNLMSSYPSDISFIVIFFVSLFGAKILNIIFVYVKVRGVCVCT